jgi:hypothetical protein
MTYLSKASQAAKSRARTLRNGSPPLGRLRPEVVSPQRSAVKTIRRLLSFDDKPLAADAGGAYDRCERD